MKTGEHKAIIYAVYVIILILILTAFVEYFEPEFFKNLLYTSL